MSLSNLQKIIVGGYTKSGTTFVGRIFDNIKGVTARGEMDYFRIFFDGLNPHIVEYNKNIQIVNREVYDGFGSLKALSNNQVRRVHQNLFQEVFFGGEEIPHDIHTIVEKSPRNIFHLSAVRFVFPDAKVVCVYRDPVPVFRSLMRHMSDHRNSAFLDPESTARKNFLNSFVKNRWRAYADIIRKNRKELFLVRYDAIAGDTAGFIDFACQKILNTEHQLKAPVETLSKDAYLASLPEEARKKSLVQTRSTKIQISAREYDMLTNRCSIPDGPFDF